MAVFSSKLTPSDGLRIENTNENETEDTHYSRLLSTQLNVDGSEVVIARNWLNVREAGFSTVNARITISNTNKTDSVPTFNCTNVNCRVTDDDGTDSAQEWYIRTMNDGHLSLFPRTAGSAVVFGKSNQHTLTVSIPKLVLGTDFSTNNESYDYIRDGIPNSQSEYDREGTCNLYLANWAHFTNVESGLITVTDLRYKNSSDIRLKNIYPDRPDCVSKIKSLGDVVSYRYKSPEELAEDNLPVIDTLDLKNKHTGLVYQNVSDADIPTFTGKGKEGYGYINYLSPDYQAILLGAVQQLIKRVEDLEKKVK